MTKIACMIGRDPDGRSSETCSTMLCLTCGFNPAVNELRHRLIHAYASAGMLRLWGREEEAEPAEREELARIRWDVVADAKRKEAEQHGD